MPVPGLRRLFRLVGRPPSPAEDVDAELRFHFEAQVEDLVAGGLSPDEAVALAERRFGDRASYRSALIRLGRRGARRRSRRDRFAAARQDLRQSIRSLTRVPAFVVGVALTLALGLGVNTTMVGLVDDLLFRPPAHVVDPARVVRYVLTETDDNGATYSNTGVTWYEYRMLAEGSHTLSNVAAYFAGGVSLGRGERARRLTVAAATPAFFPLLGVSPSLGRFFGPEEDPLDGGSTVAVISDRLWDRDFGRGPVLGRQLELGRHTYTVIGVAPPHFNGVDLDGIDAWLPFQTGAQEFVGTSGGWRDTWNWQWLHIVGRLAPGVTRGQAAAEATALYRAHTADVPDRKNDRGVVSLPPIVASQGENAARAARVAALLAAVSVLVLLITCANVANLLLARGLAQRRETAVRLALGVARGRLVGSMLVESGMLTFLGAVGGGALAVAGGVVVRRWLLPGIDFVTPPVDGRLLVLTAGLALLTAILIGLVPALRTTRTDVARELTAAGAGAGLARRHARLRNGLLGVQGVLSFVLLFAGGLFTRSLQRVAALDLGFRPSGLLVADADLTGLELSRDQRIAFSDEAYRRFQHLPGIESVSLGSTNPFQTRYTVQVKLPDRDSLPRISSGQPRVSVVTPEYFRTMGIDVVRGRAFTPEDRLGSKWVVVVNQTMARTLWPGRDPIGQCLIVTKDVPDCREVVGVVADANTEALEEPPTMAYFVPHAQPTGLTADRTLFIRVAGSAPAMIEPIRRLVQTLRPGLPHASVHLLSDQMEPLVRPWRLGAALFGVMGAVALLVVLVGIYSVLSYTVAQRVREFGIRTALGASRGDIVRSVVGQGQRIVGLSVAIGLGLAFLLGRLLEPMLFHTSWRDPLVIVGGVAVVAVTTLIASVMPAVRAGGVAPLEAMRAD